MPWDIKKRRAGTRPPRRIVLIICEGTKTEPLYFRHFNERFSRVLVKTIPGKGTDPVSIVEHAIVAMEEEDIDLKLGDGVWCVLDVDQNTNAILKKALELAKSKGIRIAISNPLFELWYLLHFSCSTKRKTGKEVLQELKGLCGYNKSRDIFLELSEYQETAMENAEQLVKHHGSSDRDIFLRESNPVTTVHQLIQFLKELREKNR